MLQTIQCPFAGHNGDQCQPDDLKVYKKGVFLNVEQAQTALPGLMTWLYLWIMSASNSPCSLMFFLSTSLAGQWLDGRPKRLWTFRSNRPRHKMAAGPPEKFLLRTTAPNMCLTAIANCWKPTRSSAVTFPPVRPSITDRWSAGARSSKTSFTMCGNVVRQTGRIKKKRLISVYSRQWQKRFICSTFRYRGLLLVALRQPMFNWVCRSSDKGKLRNTVSSRQQKKCLHPFHDHFGM